MSRPLDHTPPALGDVPGGGAGQGTHRGADQDPPGDGRRHQRVRHRPGHPGRLGTAGAGGRRGAVDAAPRGRRDAAGGGSGRGRSEAVARPGTGAWPDRRTSGWPPGTRWPPRARWRGGRPACSRWHGPRAGGRRARRSTSRSPPPAGSPWPARELRVLPEGCGPRTAAPSTTWCSVVVSGALRNWLLSRGEPVSPSSTLRAMVPLSVRGRGRRAQLGHRRRTRQPGVVVHRGSAGRGAQPDGAAAPRDPRDARAHVHRGSPSVPTPWSGSVGSPRLPCTPWGPARRAGSRSGSSTWW